MNCIFWILLLTSTIVEGRIHKLEIKNDARRYITLTTFGFYKGGILTVNLTNFRVKPFNDNAIYGFSLDKSKSDTVNPYLDNYQERCLLNKNHNFKNDLESKGDDAIIYFIMDFKNLQIKVSCSSNVKSLHIHNHIPKLNSFRKKRGGFAFSKINSDSQLLHSRYNNHNAHHELSNDKTIARNKRSNSEDGDNAEKPAEGCLDKQLNMSAVIIDGEQYFNAEFAMYITNEDEEGLYNLYFHNCANFDYNTRSTVNFEMHIAEINNGNFLSAGEMPLPSLYFLMSSTFFISGCLWVYILKKSQNPVFKIHYLMAVLIYLKSFSLLFHGINYHFIQTKGEHVAAWAILYYITHLLKGAVLFITIVLIGTGWDFIKHILADKDKKLFMIVIPLQVLANVAEIIIEESEEGDVEYKTWRDIFILVDLLCCGAILFPVVWSIKHLRESTTSGKAAINLRKLKLFRHFYIMIVCYIYFTRIIMYLLKMTVPYQYEWLDQLFKEMATYIFFVLTGYKFRPASANPYFTLNDDISPGDDDEMDVVVTANRGLPEGLGKVSRAKKNLRLTTEVILGDEESQDLINKREASHEYD
ncbi:protein GPR107 isoform X2 [Chelonus insularis]|uniref:protein GPR107 isoform X2 n=1 Tax=Chelonus insularis TaxID=460826 RepID=UPI00158B8C84|nr:protein GPR107 isoform X2 [Chelonus insularis]